MVLETVASPGIWALRRRGAQACHMVVSELMGCLTIHAQIEGEDHKRLRGLMLSIVGQNCLPKLVSPLDELAMDHVKSFQDGTVIESVEAMLKVTARQPLAAIRPCIHFADAQVSVHSHACAHRF